MQRILKIEWAKVAPYSLVKVILILSTALFLLVVFIGSQIDISIQGFTWKNVYIFPNIWKAFAWVASWFNLLLAILVIVITGNEIVSKSFRQQVITGYSRNEWLFGKGFLILALSVFSITVVTISTIIFGIIFTPAFSFSMIFEGSSVIFVLFLQSIAYMIIGLLFINIFRSNSLAIILYLLYFIIIEPFVRLLMPHDIRAWFPIKIIRHLTPMPEFLKITSQGGNIDPNALSFEQMGIMAKQLSQTSNLILAFVYVAIFCLLIWWIVRNYEL